MFEILIEGLAATEDFHIFPEFVPQPANLLDRLLQSGFVAGHPHMIPHDFTERAVELIDTALAVCTQQRLDTLLTGFERPLELSVIGGDLFELARGEVITYCVRDHEVSICESLHEGTGPETIRPVIGKIRFTEYV